MADERPRGRLGPPEGSLTQGWANAGPGKLLPERLNAGPNEQSEGTLRRYLLGGYPPGSDAIDHAILAEGASPMLDVIEDELIEEYVTGEMSDADRSLFENRFLSSKQRLEKIRLSAMLLGRPDVAEHLHRRVASVRQGPKSNVARVDVAEGLRQRVASLWQEGPKSKVTRVLVGLAAAVVVAALIAALVWFLQAR
jgi:hypothetical protein